MKKLIFLLICVTTNTFAELPFATNQDEFEKVIATIRKLTRVVSTMTLNVTNPE